ncbi:MAG: exosortase/archaeosortase family protein [Phycisphaerales bacterium]|nr:MAG: exosortase/archaeosortase family protein [Phycisphaerales bacterium]
MAIVAGALCLVFRHEMRRIVGLWLSDPSWSHGFLIPLFSLYFINRKRDAILSLEHARDPLAEFLAGRRPPRLGAGQTRPNYLGLLLLVGTLAFYAFNVVSPAGYAYFRPLAMIGALGAVVLFLGGGRLLAQTWLPIVFLVFAVPLPRRYYVGLTMPMRELAATVATALLNMVSGLEARCSGVVIDIVYQGRHLEPALDVAEACSGMRLLMAFLALGVAMAYLHERPLGQRLILLASTVPIAVFCNIVRVTVTGFIYVLADPKYTQGIYHDALGLAMLPLAFGLYGFLAWFMASLFVEEGHGDRSDVIVRKRVTE